MLVYQYTRLIDEATVCSFHDYQVLMFSCHDLPMTLW